MDRSPVMKRRETWPSGIPPMLPGGAAAITDDPEFRKLLGLDWTVAQRQRWHRDIGLKSVAYKPGFKNEKDSSCVWVTEETSDQHHFATYVAKRDLKDPRPKDQIRNTQIIGKNEWNHIRRDQSRILKDEAGEVLGVVIRNFVKDLSVLDYFNEVITRYESRGGTRDVRVSKAIEKIIDPS